MVIKILITEAIEGCKEEFEADIILRDLSDGDYKVHKNKVTGRSGVLIKTIAQLFNEKGEVPGPLRRKTNQRHRL